MLNLCAKLSLRIGAAKSAFTTVRFSRNSLVRHLSGGEYFKVKCVSRQIQFILITDAKFSIKDEFVAGRPLYLDAQATTSLVHISHFRSYDDLLRLTIF
jgi:hypothetical protein